MFTAVQPLYSLTQDNRKYKFRQPPQLTDFDEIVEFYIERVSRENVLDDILFVLEGGMPLENLSKLLIRLIVAEGVHTIEQGFLVRPILFEYLKGLADDAGIEYKERFSNKAESEEKALTRAAFHVKKQLKGRKKDEGVEMLMAAAETAEGSEMSEEEMGMPEEGMPVEEMMPAEEGTEQLELDLGGPEQERPSGLMARG
jgi:hypothetical protein